MKKFDLKKAILENKATFFSSLTEGYDEFKRADKGSKDVTAKDKGEEEVYGAGVEKGEEIEKKKMKMSELKGKIKKMVMAEMALDIDTMEDAPESEVDFLAELEGILGEENEFNMNKPARIANFITALNRLVDEYHAELYLNDDLFAALEMVIKAANEEATNLNEAKEDEEVKIGYKFKDDGVKVVVIDIDPKRGTVEVETIDGINSYESDAKNYGFVFRDNKLYKELTEAKKEDANKEEIEINDEFSTEEPQGPGKIDVTQNADADLTGDKKSVQDNLEAALEAAKSLGDDKLATQIGNSLTFFTKQHVVK